MQVFEKNSPTADTCVDGGVVLLNLSFICLVAIQECSS